MYYTNGSTITKTFHGVTFKPGETKEVFGIINDPKFVQSPMRQEPPKRVRSTSSKSEELVEKKSRKKATKLVETSVASKVDEKSENKPTEEKSTDAKPSDIDKEQNIENKEV